MITKAYKMNVKETKQNDTNTIQINSYYHSVSCSRIKLKQKKQQKIWWWLHSSSIVSFSSCFNKNMLMLMSSLFWFSLSLFFDSDSISFCWSFEFRFWLKWRKIWPRCGGSEDQESKKMTITPIGFTTCRIAIGK